MHARYFVDISYCQPGDYLTNNGMGRKEAPPATGREVIFPQATPFHQSFSCTDCAEK